MREVTLTAPVEVIYHSPSLRLALIQHLGLNQRDWIGYHLKKRSVDARRAPIKGRVIAQVFESEEEWRAAHPHPLPQQPLHQRPLPLPISSSRAGVLIIGAGPAGLFAALRALSLGIKPIIIERGKEVRERRRDLALLNRTGVVNPHSNYCFGEGGAGTYSDGKLYTRTKRREVVKLILQCLADHGAPKEICYEAHPHIGTNKLPKIIESIRESVRRQGGEILFNAHMTHLIRRHQSGTADREELIGVRLADGRELTSQGGVILATGHSARDIFEMLHAEGLKLEAKPFALGVRAEHHQSLIDHIQYHGARPDPLGSASYRLVTQVEDHGVFSFCMCPGGIIAPASTASQEIVINGWSPYKRNGQYANSGIVVSVDHKDFAPYQAHGVLAGLAFQRAVERSAFEAGGSTGLIAPAQRLTDFIAQKQSSTLPPCSYIPGIQSADLNQVLPAQISRRLRVAFQRFGERLRGYINPEAIIVGVESRTSSPVRIPRDPTSLEHPELRGLFPCGEGAGYAGGIISAALDGLKCAEAISRRLCIDSSQDLWSEHLTESI